MLTEINVCLAEQELFSKEAGGYIKAGKYIEAGGSFGIVAGLQITCEGVLYFGLKCFAGICTWREISEDEKTITCAKKEGNGVIEYGILKETGIKEESQKEVIELNGKKYQLIEG